MSPSPHWLHSIRKFFFGTPSKTIASVSTIVTFISIATTIAYFQYPEPLPWFIVARDMGVVILLLLVAAIATVGYTYRGATIARQNHTIRQARESLSQQLKQFHDLVHNYRSTVYRFVLYSMPNRQQLLTNPDFFNISERELSFFRSICQSVTENLRDSLIELFKSRGIDIGNDIAIAVKLIIPSDKVVELFQNDVNEEAKNRIRTAQSQWILTVYRDLYTYSHKRDRETAGRKIYSIEGNTAFNKIVMGKDDYFLENDLMARHRRGEYSNENENWPQQYNTALVAPIRYKSTNSSDYICFGLLAIDSLNEQKRELFDQDCVQIMGHAADLMADCFLLLALFQFYEAANSANQGSMVSR